MMSQTNFYSSSNVEKSPHEITMTAIASRLREIHSKMRRKEPPLPFVEEPFSFLESDERKDALTSKTHINKQEDAQTDARLDEINRAILFDYQDRQKKEKLIFCALSTIIARLDEGQINENTVTTTSVVMDVVEPSMPLLDALCVKLEEQFFKKQQTTLDRLSHKIDQLSRDIREATAASRHNVQFGALQNEINNVYQLINNQKLPNQTFESQENREAPEAIQTDVQIDETRADETKTDTTQDALSILLKSIPVQAHEKKTQKPFDIHASARLIDAARKNR